MIYFMSVSDLLLQKILFIPYLASTGDCHVRTAVVVVVFDLLIMHI